MELTTLIGILSGFAAIIISILISEGADIMSFVDLPSVFITIGGTIAATLVAYPITALKSMGGAFKMAFRKKEINLQKDIDLIISIANIARREGLLALEDTVRRAGNEFFRKGMMLVVDGADPELIKDVMEAEIYFMQERHAESQQVIETMGALAPAYGMIGTLIGLINMLKNLNDVSSLGPGMAVALVTTFYGSVLANLVFIPMAKKLRIQTTKETLEKELLLEGLLSIQDGENPRIIKDRLYSFIARRDNRGDEMSSVSTKSEVEEIAHEPAKEG